MWATSEVMDVDGLLVGVRTNAPEVSGVVRTALGGGVVDADADVDPLLSIDVRLEPRTSGRQQSFHALYVDGCLVLRSRVPERVLHATLAQLRPAWVDGTIALDAHAVVGREEAAIVPRTIAPDLAVLERRLMRLGVRNVDAGFVAIDVESGLLVVPPPPALADGLLDGLTVYRADEAGSVAPGSYAIRGWLLDDHGEGPVILDDGGLPLWRLRALIDRVEAGAKLVYGWIPWPDDVPGAVLRLTRGEP